MKNIKLSENWYLNEFRCRCSERGFDWCGGAAPIQERLVTLLQRARDIAGKSLYCIHSSNQSAGSGFRCIPYNKHVGGVPESFHTRGMAADIWSPYFSVLELQSIFEQAMDELGYGWIKVYLDKGFVHVDIGER